LCILNNALREDVIVISSLPKPLTRKLFQVPFSRFASLLLKLATDTEDAPFLFLPASFPQELTFGRHGWSIETQVNADHLIRRGKSRLRKGNNDMEGKTSFTVAQVSTTDFVSDILHKMLRDGKGQFNPPIYSSQATGESIPLHPVRTNIIANTRSLTVGALDGFEWRGRLALLESFLNLLRIGFFVLYFPRQSRLNRLSGLHTSGTHQLSRKVGILGAKRIVRAFVQLNPIATLASKALVGHGIEAGSMLFKRLFQEFGLFRRRMELYRDRSIHTESISYISKICQENNRKETGIPPHSSS